MDDLVDIYGLTIGEHIYYLDRQFPQYIVEVIAIHNSVRTKWIWVSKWWGGYFTRRFDRVQHVTLKNNIISETIPMDIARNWKRVDTE
jgi:hypothetical protein